VGKALSDHEHYQNIFAVVGFVRLLHTSKPEDFTHDVLIIQDMLSNCVADARSYKGNNQQILTGYREILEFIPTLQSFHPNLH
jgi:hypothetical protein